jgi:hypothetical protein
VRAPPPEGDGQQELRAGRGDMPACGLDLAADDDLQGHEAEHARQPFSLAREGLPAADLGPEDFRVPSLNQVGYGEAAENGHGDAEHRLDSGYCPAMSEQRGDVMARLGAEAESASDDDGTGQAGAENGRQDPQQRDEAECEHGRELQRTVDHPEPGQLSPDPAGHGRLQAAPPGPECFTGLWPGIC